MVMYSYSQSNRGYHGGNINVFRFRSCHCRYLRRQFGPQRVQDREDLVNQSILPSWLRQIDSRCTRSGTVESMRRAVAVAAAFAAKDGSTQSVFRKSAFLS